MACISVAKDLTICPANVNHLALSAATLLGRPAAGKISGWRLLFPADCGLLRGQIIIYVHQS
jgi:hypothetical protein